MTDTPVPMTADFVARLRKALAEGQNWDVRALASAAADRLERAQREHISLGKLADQTASELDKARAEITRLTAERDDLKTDRDIWQEANASAIKALVEAPTERDLLEYKMMNRDLNAERDALRVERDQWKANHEALQWKVDGEKSCCCAYDHAASLCGYHSPQVIAAEARALAAEAAREQAYLDGIVVGKKARDAEIADEDGAIAEEEYAP